MLLSELFKGAPEIEIEQLSADSRVPMKNAVFFCISGLKYDGHDFISEAISNGAKVIVYQEDIERKEKAIYVKVKNVNDALIKAANIFYDYPLKDMSSYIVSGCYGRSSVSSLIYEFLNTKIKAAYIGRFGIKYETANLEISFPTLTIIDNMLYLSKMKNANVKAVTFEASSSSLSYQKLDFIKPDVFVYTNTYKNSPDYKELGDDYYNTILRYFYTLDDKTRIILNRDDDSFLEFKNSISNFITYGFDENSNYQISEAVIGDNGVNFKLLYNHKNYSVRSKLLSKANIYNITAAIVALVESGYDINEIIEFINNVDYIEGVYQLIKDDYHIIIDCAYTVDAIKNILNYGKFIMQSRRLVGILSISYWMDEETVKQLISLAEENLDTLIITIDETDERLENNLLSIPKKYIKLSKTTVFEDREVAIEQAISLLNKSDILLITGKGNESHLITSSGKKQYETDYALAVKYIKERKYEED